MEYQEDKKPYFEGKKEEALQAIRVREKRMNRIMIYRTATFALFLFGLAAGYDGYPFCYGVAAVFLALFIVFVGRHSRERIGLLHDESRLALAGDYLKRIAGKGAELTDDGAEFLREDLPQGRDLHLFGHASLYQYICAARTREGRERLAAALSPEPSEPAAVKRRQEIVKELLEKRDFSFDLEAMAALLPERYSVGELTEAMRSASISSIYSWLRFLPVFSFGALALFLAGLCPAEVPEGLFILNFVLAAANYARISDLFSSLAEAAPELKIFEELFTRLEREEFRAGGPLAADLAVLSEPSSAARALARLARITTLAEQRQNVFFFAVFNTLFLWDFHCLTAYRDFQRTHGEALSRWLALWPEMELYLSLAVIARTRRIHVFPEVVADGPVFHAERMTNPLIGEASAVANDADFTAKTTIITGSNMSGKTTYMRTIGLTAVLAYAGAPVCASACRLSPMHVFTSIQVNDDLSQGISTFYAEILRIKSMVVFAKEKKPMLICIDEIFKGTNSADRIVGAQATVKRLTTPWCVTLVTTHDFELCDIKEPAPVANLHFEEHYVDGKIAFDYLVKDGRCHTTDARYLLKMAGIMEE